MDINIRMANSKDENEILEIYHSLIGTLGCTWSEEYPSMEDIRNDISKKSLYVMCDKNKIIAVAAAGKDTELEDLTCWSRDIKQPCDLARIGVLKEFQNRGLAKKLVKYIENDVKKRGFDGIHFLVSKTNPSALSIYNKLGYKSCGETNMYDISWFCYEKPIYDIPINTLFMLMSLDGKINSGDSDKLDPDKDWCKIDGVKEGLHQYYEIEQTTDWYSLNTGRVMAKIGINERNEKPKKVEVRFVILDRKPHLNEKGIEYLCNWTEKTFIVTDNKQHPAYKLLDKFDNLEVLYYDDIDLLKLMKDLKKDYGVEKITIQSGGTLNGEFLRDNLIDYVNVVIAPLLVGGANTNTLIDGKAIKEVEELNKLKALKLIECNILEDSYINLKYEVIK